jgi:hypothetical protein
MAPSQISTTRRLEQDSNACHCIKQNTETISTGSYDNLIVGTPPLSGAGPQQGPPIETSFCKDSSEVQTKFSRGERSIPEGDKVPRPRHDDLKRLILADHRTKKFDRRPFLGEKCGDPTLSEWDMALLSRAAAIELKEPRCQFAKKTCATSQLRAGFSD